MKISDVSTFPVLTPPPHYGGEHWMFVRVETDGGIVGYGEMKFSFQPFRLPVLAAMIEDIADQYLVGYDPSDIEAFWDRLYARAGGGHNPDIAKLGILSALEMACWDIMGKHLGVPVYRLLGGRVRERVRTYTYLAAAPGAADVRQANRALWQDPSAAAQRVRQYVDQGFTAIKLDPFSSTLTFDQTFGQLLPIEYSLQALDRAEAVVRAIRHEVGSTCDIIIGTHGQMTAAGAIRVAKRLEQFDPLWFEEPVPPENAAEMAKVAAATTMPITAGERLTTKYAFQNLISHKAAAVFNFDVGQVGGLLEAKKIAAMADANYLQIAPHHYSGPIIAAASLHLAVSTPNLLIMEAVGRLDGFHADLIDPPLEWRDGYLIPSERPGFGHDLREDVARRYAPDGPGPSLLRSRG